MGVRDDCSSRRRVRKRSDGVGIKKSVAYSGQEGQREGCEWEYGMIAGRGGDSGGGERVRLRSGYNCDVEVGWVFGVKTVNAKDVNGNTR
jgi:hypothetical protein